MTDFMRNKLVDAIPAAVYQLDFILQESSHHHVWIGYNSMSSRDLWETEIFDGEKRTVVDNMKPRANRLCLELALLLATISTTW